MIAICPVEDDICILGFGFEQIGAVEIAVYEADFGVLRTEFGSFVAVSNESCDGEIGVFFCYCEEGIASDVACRSGPVCPCYYLLLS